MLGVVTVKIAYSESGRRSGSELLLSSRMLHNHETEGGVNCTERESYVTAAANTGIGVQFASEYMC